MVFYLQQAIHENTTQQFNSYAAIHEKEQHVRQNCNFQNKIFRVID